MWQSYSILVVLMFKCLYNYLDYSNGKGEKEIEQQTSFRIGSTDTNELGEYIQYL